MIRQGTNPRLADLVNRGEILPDHMATSILAERLHENDCASGAILDGCARSIGQAISIGKLLAATGPSLTAALHLMVSEEVAFGHIEARSHIAGLGREDHDPPVTRRRMEVFNEVTTKVLEYYRSEGLLYEVDGSGFPLDVHARIMSALGTTLNEA
jgi:adenylate kinase